MASKRVLQQLENARLGAQTECYIAISFISGEIQRRIRPSYTFFEVEETPALRDLAQAVQALAVAARELETQVGATVPAQYSESVSPGSSSSST